MGEQRDIVKLDGLTARGRALFHVDRLGLYEQNGADRAKHGGAVAGIPVTTDW